jgi:hypothetical protein
MPSPGGGGTARAIGSERTNPRSKTKASINEKLERIRESINAVAEEPEDLHQLVLGIARPGMLDTVSSEATFVPRAKLDEWFDRQTGQMGGEDAVPVVQDLLGHAQHFDFAQISDRVPKLDLHDLAPFFRLALRQNRRQLSETDGLWAFKTPDAWQTTAGVKPRYDDIHFERKATTRRKGTVLGVGTRLFDVALKQACQFDESNTLLSDNSDTSLQVYRCYDRITGNLAQPKAIIFGVITEGKPARILTDRQVLLILNDLAAGLKPSAEPETIAAVAAPGNGETLAQAESLLRDALPSFDVPFRQPDLELLGIVVGLERIAA